jgi:MarR family transcriptional regulator, organic hydroperoxide resistance regulator
LRLELVGQMELTYRQVQRRMTSLWHDTHSSGLTLPQVNLLIQLERQGQVNMSDLAEVMCTTPSNLSLLCDKLADKGLIERDRDAVDRRMVYLQLSAQGKLLVQTVKEAKNGLVARALAGIDEDELEGMLNLYKRILHNLNSY